MNTLIKFCAAPLAFSVLFACDPTIDAPTPSADGKIDLSKYVSIGNSLTAGYASNGLFLEGQKVAYSVLLAEQFKLAGGGEFNAPLFSADQAEGTGYLKLTGFLTPTTPILTSMPGSPNLPAGVNPIAVDPLLNPTGVVFKPFEGTRVDNWGVPGIRLVDVDVPGYGWKNPYLGRLLAETEKNTTSYMQKVIDQKPTFFSCWLGNNDILGYSTSGGVEILAAPTAPDVFDTKYNNFINTMMAANPSAKGVVANIPDVTSIPFFTTVGPSLKSALPATGIFELNINVELLTQLLGILSGQLPAPLVIPTTAGNILPGSIATVDPATKNIVGDVFIPLTASSHAPYIGKPYGKAWNSVITTLVSAQFALIQPNVPPGNLTVGQIVDSIWKVSGLDSTQPFGVHPLNPLPDNLVLNSSESTLAKSIVASYNATIKATAERVGLAHVDANSALGNITRGSYYDAISTNSAFISGGAFSLDGVHLTPRGNAITANEFIKAINAKYGTKITVLNPSQFKGVIFP